MPRFTPGHTVAVPDRGPTFEPAPRSALDHRIPDVAAVEVRVGGQTTATNHLRRDGHLLLWSVPATAVLVQTLLNRGTNIDVAEAEAAIKRLAAAPTDEGPGITRYLVAAPAGTAG